MKRREMNTWHYPRRDLAESYLKQLDSGLNSIAIFAERRKGKTEFLLEDLTPLAHQMGYRTAYINFWEKKSDPIHCILKGVKRSFERDNALRTLSKWKKEISLKIAGLQAKVSTDGDKIPAVASDALDYLLIPKGGILIMFDEIQQLAAGEENDELVATLRTFLDSNRRKVRAVFTGSSQDRLNKMFKQQKAAFYRSASLVEFPNMGEEFVASLANRFHYLSQRHLNENKLFEVFQRHHYSPFIIVDLLQTLLREGIYEVEQGYHYYLAKNDPNMEFRELWEGLKLVDQILLTEVILKSKPLYHRETYELLAGIMGVDKIGRGVVQHAVNRLRDRGILNKEGHGQWAFESGEFKAFVEQEC